MPTYFGGRAIMGITNNNHIDKVFSDGPTPKHLVGSSPKPYTKLEPETPRPLTPKPYLAQDTASAILDGQALSPRQKHMFFQGLGLTALGLGCGVYVLGFA